MTRNKTQSLWPLPALLLLLAGCSSAEPEPKPAIVCEMTRTLGSQIPKRVCKSQAQIEAEREASQEGMRRTLSGPNVGNLERQ